MEIKMKTTISKSNYKIQAKKKKTPTETESTMRSFNVTLL